jgi:imidazolonepropionase-like amidohydrolase
MRQLFNRHLAPTPQAAAMSSFLCAALAISIVFTPPSASAQGRETIIREATILVGDGRTLESASVTIRGEKIGAVGLNVRGGATGRTIDGKGKFVTPGLIDAWCTLASEAGEQGRPGTAVALDGFNRFERDQIEAALKQGVTTAFLPARAAGGVGGMGSVIRLLPDATDKDRILREEAALCAGIGLDPRLSVLARARAAGEFRKAWLDAKQYRKSFETYDEDLKEYEEKIKKRAEENKDKPKDQKSVEKKEEKKDEKPEEKVREPDPPRPPRPDRPRPGRRPPGTPRAESRPESRPDADAEKKDDKKDDIKKPTEPPKDPTKEALLKAIDGKLAVRIEAQRPEDIQNALAVAKEFNLALAIDGGSGAVPLARELAFANVPVILAADPPMMQFSPGLQRYAQADAAAKLAAANVKVVIGSGPGVGDGPTRHLALAAARLVGSGIDEGRAFRMITGDAAEVLGLDDQIGRVAPGLSADLVIWSDHPLSPNARVEQVFVRGREVYKADDGKPAASEPAGEEHDTSENEQQGGK